MQKRLEHLHRRLEAHFFESAEIKRRMVTTSPQSILATAELIANTFRSGGKIMLCGNGGSAADCQHMAAEFVSRLSKDFERPGLPAIALTTDTSFLTAYANDYGLDGIFERQVEALGKPGDTLLGISTSGNSTNVIRAVNAAQNMGLQTIGLTGEGGQLASLTLCSIIVPSRNTQIIQECLLSVEHILCEMVEQDLFGSEVRVVIGHEHLELQRG